MYVHIPNGLGHAYVIDLLQKNKPTKKILIVIFVKQKLYRIKH